MKEERNIKIDIIKGIAILLVLLGHTIQYTSLNTFDFFENKIFIFIYSFHMPLFMIISGYLFYKTMQKPDVVKNVIKRVKKYLLLILFFTIINYYIDAIKALIIHQKINNIFSAGWISQLNGYWFLWSIISSTVITTLSYKMTDNNILRKILLIISFPLVYIFPNGDNNLFMYMMFLTGFLYNEYKNKIPEKIKNIKYIIFFVFPFLLLLWKKEMYIYTTGMFNFSGNQEFINQILIDFYRNIFGILGSIFVITGVEILFKFKGKIINKILNKIQELGKNSLKIYMIQRIVIENIFVNIYVLICNYMGKNIFYINKITYYIFVFITFILLTMIIKLIINILNKYNISKYIFLEGNNKDNKIKLLTSKQ